MPQRELKTSDLDDNGALPRPVGSVRAATRETVRHGVVTNRRGV